MPEKSVREMGRFERKHYSLEGRTFRAVIICAAILGLVAFLVGQGLYIYALIGQYVGETFGLAKSTAAIINNVADTGALSKDIMEIYRSMYEEERSGTGTEEYREKYRQITEREDYQRLRSYLRIVLDSSDVNDVYFACYDWESSAIVYLVDPDEREGYICMPGDNEKVSDKECRKFLDWNGEGKLYHIGQRHNYIWICTSGVPVYGESGELAGFVLADVSLSEVAAGIRSFFIQYTVILSVATVAVAFFMTRHMKKTLVKPINEIAEAAQNYVSDRRSGIKNTDHFSKLDIKTGDEVENLSLVMGDMEKDLADYEESLMSITSEKERIKTELSLATRIQADMLPNIYPAFPERPEIDIYATMDPAKEVGGDFYDYFLIDDDHLCMVMADVSGKGVPAALFMMASKIILSNNAMAGKSPAQILTDMNATVCSNNREEMFVTVWLGIFEISTGKLTAANAGHEYPVIKQPDGKYELLKDKHGFVIGGMDGVRYKEYELTLEPGSKLFLYTDGVPEATDSSGEMFGTERMTAALNAVSDAAPDKTLRNVREAVDSFVKGAEQFDDITMMCMEYRNNGTQKGREKKDEI